MTRTLHAVTRGTGPRLALVHGFTQTGASWGPVADDLATDHQVVRIDVPGHGASASVRADLEEGAHLLADVGGPATYVGYSMGARFALHVALAEPEVVHGLVLISGTGGIDDAAERAARRQADEARAEEIETEGVGAFVDAWLAQPLFEGLADSMAFRGERLTNTAEGLSSSLRLAGTGTQRPLWDDLGAVSAPTLVVTGELDARFGALGERLVAAIGPGTGGAAEHVVIGGAGHTVHLEQPDAFLAAVRPWLAAQGL